MPAFGLTMKIPAEYENLTWYGNGPDENYSDRKHGARLGIFSNKVADNVSPYSKPQECGNKTDVRWFTVSDSTGNGLKISAKSTVEFSALPYTSHELENASHHYDLPNIHNTVLTINKVQMGVGGDDSFGRRGHGGRPWVRPAGGIGCRRAVWRQGQLCRLRVHRLVHPDGALYRTRSGTEVRSRHVWQPG